jgi:hypothetical protein
MTTVKEPLAFTRTIPASIEKTRHTMIAADILQNRLSPVA